MILEKFFGLEEYDERFMKILRSHLILLSNPSIIQSNFHINSFSAGF